MNRFFVFLCFFMVSLCGFAQIEKYPYVSTSQTGGRFEIIQSPIARRFTFRLDKYTGDVYQLVLANDNTLVWEKIPNSVLIMLHDDNKKPDYIRFQLFMSGIALADCFLLDMDTGVTFKLYEDESTGSLFFKYMKGSHFSTDEKDNDDD